MLDRDSLAMKAKVQAGDEIVAVDNQLVGDTPQDLDHVISYIRTYIKSDRPKLSFRFRRIDFPQREIAKMPLDNKTTKKSNSTKKKVGRWLRKRLSSGSDKKKKESSKSPRSWKASLGGMWAKANEVASNASKNLRNMKSSDDDPASYGLVLLLQSGSLMRNKNSLKPRTRTMRRVM